MEHVRRYADLHVNGFVGISKISGNYSHGTFRATDVALQHPQSGVRTYLLPVARALP